MRRRWSLLLLAFLGSSPAGAQTPPSPGPREDLVGLREELKQLREEYESRFSAIEKRIQALEGQGESESPEGDPLLREAEAALGDADAPQARPVVPAGAGGGPQSLNPQISVIGDFLGAANENVPDFGTSLDLREVEIAFQAQIDPFARADFFVTIPSLEDVEMEEGYVTFLTLPSDFLVRLGKVRVPFGRANVDHRPESFTVDRPDVVVGYFGEEGLAETGVSVSRLLPNPWDRFMELELDVLAGSNDVSFGGGSASDLLYNLRYRSFFDLSPEQSLNVGASYATGVHPLDQDRSGRTQLGGVDVTYVWKPLARGKYRSFLWQTELMGGTRDLEAGARDSFGLYSFSRYQLSRRWYVGGRFDYSQSPELPDLSSRSGSALVEFFATEFQRFRLQYKVTDKTSQPLSHQLFFQWFYLIGTHGAHKF